MSGNFEFASHLYCANNLMFIDVHVPRFSGDARCFEKKKCVHSNHTLDLCMFTLANKRFHPWKATRQAIGDPSRSLDRTCVMYPYAKNLLKMRMSGICRCLREDWESIDRAVAGLVVWINQVEVFARNYRSHSDWSTEVHCVRTDYQWSADYRRRQLNALSCVFLRWPKFPKQLI